jgi:hypothetical protein
VARSRFGGCLGVQCPRRGWSRSRRSGPGTIAVACDEVALENAITTANASSTGAVLNLTSHCTYKLTDLDNNGTQGPNGLPVVTNLITVNGWGATITPGWPAPPIRILELEAGANVVLKNLTVSGGHAAYGGGIYVGDGAVVALNHVTLSHNVAGGTPGTGVGGGAYVGLNGGSGGGTLTMTNSVVRDNSGVEGGGFANLGTVIVTGSAIEGNSATCSSLTAAVSPKLVASTTYRRSLCETAPSMPTPQAAYWTDASPKGAA